MFLYIYQLYHIHVFCKFIQEPGLYHTGVIYTRVTLRSVPPGGPGEG